MILLPTLNRIELLKRFIESYKKTHATVPVRILVDNEDFTRHNQYSEIVGLLPETMMITTTGQAKTMGDKVRFIWDDVKHSKWVGLLNDDHLCATDRWDVEVEKLLDGSNFLSTNDGSHNFGIVPVGLTAWSMPVLEAAGFPIFPGKMFHWFIDNVWKMIGEKTGCWLDTIHLNFPHRHVFWGEQEPDETYKLSQGREQALYNQREFEHFLKQEFEGVCERISALRKEHNEKAKFT